MLKREYGNAVHQQEAQTENTSGNRQLALLWSARILDRMGVPPVRRLFDDSVLVELGLTDPETLCSQAADVLLDRARVQGRRAELEKIDWCPDGFLARNLDFLAQRFELSDADCAVIAFMALADRFDWLKTLVDDAIRYSRLDSAAECIAAATGISVSAAHDALSLGGRIGGLGFLYGSRYSKLDPATLPDLAPDLNLMLWRADFGEDSLERRCMQRAPIAKSSVLESESLPKTLAVMMKLASAMLAGRCQAGQILVHGAAGTGKTEFARRMAELLQAHLYEILTNTHDRHLGPGDRLHCFAGAQALLDDRPSCLSHRA